MQSSCFKQSEFSVELVSAGALEGDAEAVGARHAPKSLLAMIIGSDHVPLCHVCCVMGIQLVEVCLDKPFLSSLSSLFCSGLHMTMPQSRF